MKETQSYSKLVIMATEHPVLGMLLIPYMAESGSEEGSFCLLEQAFHSSPKSLALMNEAEQKVIEIASHYTEKQLMSVYSKEKTISKFMRRLTEEPDKIKKIRLFIDKKLTEMIEILRLSDLPIYQKQSRSKLLLPHHIYRLNKKEVEIRFSFEANDTSFSYQLQCFYEGELLPLTQLKPVSVLTTNSAILLLGMDIYLFPHIEAARLLPFTKKNSISTDASFTEKYIDNILIPIARYHEFTAQGLEIRENLHPCECLLYLEETIYPSPLLQLKFRYGNQTFSSPSESDVKKYIGRNTEGDNSVSYFRRENQTEQDAISLLANNGLELIGESLFKLRDGAPERNIREWISQHHHLLQNRFILTSGLQDIPYSLDEIRIEQSFSDGPDWFELHIVAVIGNYRIPFSQFRQHILEEKHEYTLPDGRIILLPEEWFSKYANLMEIGTTQDKNICVSRPYIGIVQSLMGKAGQNNTGSLTPPKEAPIPKGLKAMLRPYQQTGYEWMLNLYRQGFNGCLADDMGLGKTLQTLTLLQQLYNEDSIDEGDTQESDKPTPEPYSSAESVDECGQFGIFSELREDNTLPRRAIQGTNATPRKPSTLIIVPTSLLHNWKRETARFTNLSMIEYNSSSYFKEGHPELLFDRYHLVLTSYGSMRSHIDILRQYCFEYIVLDESQNIKNSDSLTFKSAIQLQSNHRLVLTGTPIENSLKDLWAQFHFLQPDLLGNETSFIKHFINLIKVGDNRMEGRLRQLIHPFILRRNKSEVAPELPSLTEEVVYCDMTENQCEIYEQEKNSLRNALLQFKTDTPRPQQLTVLNGISRLRQLSCHPKMIFTDFIGTSGKLEQIIDTFETLQSEGHKVLIFSSFVKHLELIAAEFNQRDWKYALLTGTSTNRPEEIARFAQSDDIQAFLISLKAGGVGLNLTQADYVFIVDPWWNPAAEAQAISRAHRIGQNKQVIAYRFITPNSIEEKIIRLQESKRKLVETFITESENIPVLSNQEWINILA